MPEGIKGEVSGEDMGEPIFIGTVDLGKARNAKTASLSKSNNSMRAPKLLMNPSALKISRKKRKTY